MDPRNEVNVLRPDNLSNKVTTRSRQISRRLIWGTMIMYTEINTNMEY